MHKENDTLSVCMPTAFRRIVLPYIRYALTVCTVCEFNSVELPIT